MFVLLYFISSTINPANVGIEKKIESKKFCALCFATSDERRGKYEVNMNRKLLATRASFGIINGQSWEWDVIFKNNFESSGIDW